MVAVDHVDPDVTGFEVARRILGSKVEEARENIYQIFREKYGSFDLIPFLGVLYHLRDPLLALDRLRSVCDSRMVVESLVCDTRFFTGFEQSTTLDAIAPALASIPIAQFLPVGLCESAGAYYRDIDDPAQLLGKPFSSAYRAPEMMRNMGVLLQGLQIGKTMTVLDFAAGTC